MVSDGFADALKISIEALNVLEQPVSFLVEPLQAMFDLAISIFREEKVQKE